MSEHQLELNKEQIESGFDNFAVTDAQHLPDLFRKIYGEHYLSADVYDPAHYVRANQSGDYTSLLARDGRGAPVGHLAMMASAPFHGVREVGQAVVDPTYRGGGILNGLIDRSVMLADHDPSCCGLFGASLTNHPYSQRSVWRAEFIDVGFEIGFVPARMMQIEADARGPVATALQYRPFGDVPDMQTFLARAYRDLLFHLFDQLCLSRQFSTADQPLDQAGDSQIEVVDLPRFDLVRVNVFKIGSDLRQRIAAVEKQARANNRTMVQVALELASPTSDEACEELRKAGFWFGALLPRWMHVDALLLQKSLGEPYFDGIQAFTNDAKALLRFIKADADRQIALAELGVRGMVTSMA
jgi:hypothetical protein